MAKIQDADHAEPRAGQDVDNGKSHSGLVGMQDGAAMLEGGLSVLTKLNLHLTHDPAIT
jgi:hypothetical protein